MDWTTFLITTGAFKTGVWLYLLIQGFRLGLVRRYSLTYAFFAGSFAAFWVKTISVLTLGLASLEYYWIYYGTTLPLGLLALLILLWIYYLPFAPSLRRDWILLAVIPLFIAMSLTEPESVGRRILYVLFFYQTSVGFLAASRLFFSGRIKIGANLGWLLYGITIPAALQTLNRALNYLGQELWSYDAFSVVNELTTVISWCMIAYGMRSYDPPYCGEATLPIEKGEAARRLDRFRQSLWRWP